MRPLEELAVRCSTEMIGKSPRITKRDDEKRIYESKDGLILSYYFATTPAETVEKLVLQHTKANWQMNLEYNKKTIEQYTFYGNGGKEIMQPTMDTIEELKLEHDFDDDVTFIGGVSAKCQYEVAVSLLEKCRKNLRI
jgi:hypothetical protein